MPYSRHMLLIVMGAVAFVGIAAGLRMQRVAEQSSSAGIAVLVDDGIPVSAVLPKAVDPSFFNGSPTSAEAPLAPVPSAIHVIPIDPVSAQAYLVGDVSTGKIYLEKNPSAILPAASMSKLLTAVTATDMYAPTTTIEITPAEASVAADSSNLMAGERFTASELLYPLLLNSSNVAAEALASSTDRAPFMYLMSGYALEIGMSGSFFADPSGLSEYDEGSASGFFLLARYLYKSRPDILALTKIVSISVATTTGYVPLATTTGFVPSAATAAAASHGAHAFASIHPFVGDSRFLGGKTGHTTAALYTMLTILNIDGHPIAFIVLRSQNRLVDTDLLIGKVEDILIGN
jgi:D-alanyl-D-alanine carboxypeptidase